MLLVITIAGVAIVSATGQQDPVASQVERIFREQGIQRSIPEKRLWSGEADAAIEPRGPRAPATDAGDRPPRTPGTAFVDAGFQWVWIVFAAGIVVTAAWLVISRRLKERESPAAASSPAAARVELPDFEELARAGRFGDAIHALLLHAFGLLHEKSGRPLRPSLTGREVLRTQKLEGTRRESLEFLVLRAERFLFGGETATSADFAACRASFDAMRRSAA